MTKATRFATKEQAEANATGRFAGYVAIFVSQHYAASHGVSSGGWYLTYGRGTQETYAAVE